MKNTKASKRKRGQRLAETPFSSLVRYLNKLGYIGDPEGMVLRAMKWQQHDAKHWIPPYNRHIMFDTREALRVEVDPQPRISDADYQGSSTYTLWIGDEAIVP